MKTKITALLLSVAIMTSFTGCAAFDLFKDKTIQKASADGNFAITVPGAWEDAEGKLNDSADLEAMQSIKNECFMALMEKPTADEANYTLTQYAELVLQNNTDLYRTTTEDMKETKVGSYDGLVGDFTFTEDESEIHMWLYCIKTETCFGQLVVWTLESDASKNEPELKNIVQSFKEITQ